MKQIILHILFICYLLPLVAQTQSKADSLTALIRNAASDTARIDAMIDLAQEYESTDRAKAFETIKTALQLSIRKNEKQRTGKSLNILGDLYWYSGDYPQASQNYFRALGIFEQLNDPASIALCYRNIGWIYQGQGNYETALQYYNKSLEINRKLDIKPALIANYDDLAIVYKLMGKLSQALANSKKEIELARESGSERGIATAYGNLGAIYFEMKQYELALESLNYSLVAHKATNDYFNITEDYIGQARCYMMLNNPEKGIQLLNVALTLARDHGYLTEISLVYQDLAEAYATMKNFEKAYESQIMFQQIRDSLYNDQNSRQINEMSIKYEADKKEMLISSLEKSNKLADEKLQKARTFKILFALLCLMILLFAGYLLREFLQRKKTNAKLSQAYGQIELRNHEITDSISYSQRIQEASLPPKELKQQLFPEAFVLFKPKDIVSGDFYWYTEKNGIRLIAACDCTGHGVPGSLMSMIGNNILNQIVSEEGITEPALILDRLHIEVRKALKQDEHQENRDGMDIAVLAFHPGEIRFAGAQRPLWIVHEGMLREIKGDKFSIGGLQTEDRRIFTQHAIRISPGDCLYIFSDGYADQFGGPDGKKFMSRQFRELLSGLFQTVMMQQEAVLETTIERWKNGTEQVDDILVIGIRT